MSELAHSVFLSIFGVSLAAIILLIFLRRNKPYLAGEGKGVDVSAFTPTDIFCCFLLIAFYFLPHAEYIPQPKPELLEFPSPIVLILKQLIFSLPVIALYLRLSKPKLKSILGLNRCPGLKNFIIFGSIALGIHLFFRIDRVEPFLKWLSELLHADFQLQTTVLMLQKGTLGLKITMAILAVVVAPITEELIFRGGIYMVLKKYAGMIPSLLFTSIFFAIIHNSVAVMIPLMILALALTWAYERAKTIWAPIAMHMVFNAITVTTILFGITPTP